MGSVLRRHIRESAGRWPEPVARCGRSEDVALDEIAHAEMGIARARRPVATTPRQPHLDHVGAERLLGLRIRWRTSIEGLGHGAHCNGRDDVRPSCPA